MQDPLYNEVHIIYFYASKLFSVIAKYSKDNGNDFEAHTEEYHPNSLLFHTLSAKCNRQDVAFTCARLGHMNRSIYAEHLDK